MKNVLFLLDYYCENASANGICCRNVAREMVQRGYRVFVGTYRPASAPEVEELDGVQVYRTWTMPKTTHHKTQKERLLFYAKWLSPICRNPAAEEAVRTESICRTAREIISGNEIDTVICVHLPVETLIAGTILKREFPAVRFCGYMLDSMSGGMLPRFLPAQYARFRKMKWEERLLGKMDLSVLMESSRAHHEQYTSDRKWMQRAVFCDIPQITQLSEGGAGYDGSSNVHMAYVGTLADDVRTPYHFLNVLRYVSGYHIELTLAGNNYCSKDFSEILKGYAGIELRCLGTVPHDRALELLKNAHILVNFGNRTPNLVPSKIFEYMSLGKPIVSTFSTSDDTSGTYLGKYPNVLELDERDDDYRSQARALESFLSETLGASVDADYILETFYNNTPGAFVDLLTHHLN